MQNSYNIVQTKIQPYKDIFVSKGIFEINVTTVANTSIH